MADAAKATVGKVEQKVGTDDMVSHGARLEAEAEADRKAQEAEQQGKGLLNSAIGTVKDTIGGLFGSTQTQVEGKAQKAEGKTQQKLSEE